MGTNAKLLAAFAVGALLASGLFYWQTRSTDAGAAEPVLAVQSPASAPAEVAPPQSAADVPPRPATGPKPPKRVAKKAEPKQPLAKEVEPPEEVITPAEPPALPEPEPPPVAATTPPEVIPAPEVPPTPVEPKTVTVARGKLITVRLDERLASDRNLIGDAFAASLDEPLVIEGWVVAERGARVFGRIRDLDQAGKVTGTASLTLELASLTTADGQKIPLHTAGFIHKGHASKKSDAVKVGIGAAIGAALGAAIGGGKGAAIGAASGGAAGGGAVIATRGKAAVLEPETRISFRLEEPVTITERTGGAE